MTEIQLGLFNPQPRLMDQSQETPAGLYASLRAGRSLLCVASIAWVLIPSLLFAALPVVNPATVELHGNFTQAQLVVQQPAESGNVSIESADLTITATYLSTDPTVVSVNSSGRVSAVKNGTTEIVVQSGGQQVRVPVTVSGIVERPSVPFREFVSPVLSHAGCNQGACHASQFGKGGFVLSVVGFDPDKDRQAIARDRAGRRVNLLEPEQSLFLKKPLMEVSHGGGQRLQKGALDHQILAAWLRAGAPAPRNDEPDVVRLSVYPSQRLAVVGDTQQLRIVAEYSNGVQRDVTGLAKFTSLDESTVNVSAEGLVLVIGKGQAPVMIRYEGQAAVATFVSPYSQAPELAGWLNHNFVDELASKKFIELGIEPSPMCDDATFLRRAYVDAIGTLPTPEVVTAFIDSTDPLKREKLVDELLGLTGDPARDTHNDQYAALWTLKWSDLLRNTSEGGANDQRMWAMHNWIKEQFRTNRPFDEVVRELITAKGSIFSNGPAVYFQINNTPPELAEATAQLFLGTQLACAKCHHHPFEKYSQADYYSFAAFFSRVGVKSSQEFGLFGGEKVVMVRNGGEVKHPKTGKVLKPKPLDGPEMDDALDRRRPLGEWLTSKDNADFSRSIVNRYVRFLLGRGLVEPVDDMRATNPPTNPELLDRLAQHFVESGFNIKHVMRVIMTSRLYQLESQPTPANAGDLKFYSHFQVKRLAAEPLMDAIDIVTGVPTKFKNLPAGTRAIELPDAEYPDYFLNVFGKPRRVSACECERVPDENLGQALHTLNGDFLMGKISHKTGLIAKSIEAKQSDDDVITAIYLRALARRPNDSEMATARQFISESTNRQETLEDLLWSVMNSKQFLFVR